MSIVNVPYLRMPCSYFTKRYGREYTNAFGNIFVTVTKCSNNCRSIPIISNICKN